MKKCCKYYVTAHSEFGEYAYCPICGFKFTPDKPELPEELESIDKEIGLNEFATYLYLENNRAKINALIRYLKAQQ